MPALVDSKPSPSCVAAPALEVSVVPVLDAVDPVDGSCCDVVALDVSAVLVVVVVVSNDASGASDSEPPPPALESVTTP